MCKTAFSLSGAVTVKALDEHLSTRKVLSNSRKLDGDVAAAAAGTVNRVRT
jgi:hypothetical protein